MDCVTIKDEIIGALILPSTSPCQILLFLLLFYTLFYTLTTTMFCSILSSSKSLALILYEN